MCKEKNITRWIQWFASALLLSFPTQAMCEGYFSQFLHVNSTFYQIHDLYSATADSSRPGHIVRTLFSGNMVPKSCIINPTCNFMSKFSPLPNTLTASNKEPYPIGQRSPMFLLAKYYNPWDEPNHERLIPKALLGKGAVLAPFSGILGAHKVDARGFAKILGLRVVVFRDAHRANLDPEVKKWRGSVWMLNLPSLKRILARAEKGTL